MTSYLSKIVLLSWVITCTRNTWLSLFYRVAGKNITCPSKHSNSRSQSQFDSSTLRQGFSLKSNDYESVTLPKNADAFDVKDTMFGHETDVDKNWRNIMMRRKESHAAPLVHHRCQKEKKLKNQ